MKFVTDDLYGGHLRGVGHPESPERVELVAALLRADGVLAQSVPARDATGEELLRVHSRAYLDLVERETALPGPRYLSTGDVIVDRGSLAAAKRAAGGAVAAVEAAELEGEPVFALIRPPGHHAERDRGMGFCVFNNAVVAARAYRARTGGRVLIVDFDYHHGNGTEAMAGDGLSYVSTHAFPAYPGTGVESFRSGHDAVVNVPLPARGLATEAFVAVWERLLPLVAGWVRPDLLIVSAGFDYLAGDPVGDLGVGVEAAGPLGSAVAAIAGEFAQGRVAYVLEGGYLPDAIAGSIGLIARAHDNHGLPSSGADPSAVPVSVARTLARISGIPQGGTAGTSN